MKAVSHGLIDSSEMNRYVKALPMTWSGPSLFFSIKCVQYSCRRAQGLFIRKTTLFGAFIFLKKVLVLTEEQLTEDYTMVVASTEPLLLQKQRRSEPFLQLCSSRPFTVYSFGKLELWSLNMLYPVLYSVMFKDIFL